MSDRLKQEYKRRWLSGQEPEAFAGWVRTRLQEVPDWRDPAQVQIFIHDMFELVEAECPCLDCVTQRMRVAGVIANINRLSNLQKELEAITITEDGLRVGPHIVTTQVMQMIEVLEDINNAIR